MKIAVVRNRSRDGVISRLGRPSPETYGRKTVQRVIDALRDRGHTVACLEGDKTLLQTLEAFIEGDRDGLVLNMAYGIQGDARYTHVPAMLEMAGVPYTGAGPVGHAVSLDKAIAKTLMRDVGVRTPSFAVMQAPGEPLGELEYPLVVKPRHESTSFGLRLVHDRDELDAAVADVTAGFGQAALVEQYVDGREVCVALLGNAPATALPAVELDFGTRGTRLVTYDDKYHATADEPQKLCPAPIDADLARALDALALATFRACHCRDYARVDIRIDREGRPFVLEINSMASLGAGGSYVRAAAAAGYSFPALLDRIVSVARQRYAHGRDSAVVSSIVSAAA